MFALGKYEFNKKYSHSINEIIRYSAKSSRFVNADSAGMTPPKSRSYALVEAVSNYILVYGGFDTEMKTITGDAFIYRDHKWFPLKIIGYFQNRIRFASVVCGKRIFLYGGKLKQG